MNPRFTRPLAPHVLTLLKKVYSKDAKRLHGNVSNLIDSLVEYDEWAHAMRKSVDLHSHVHEHTVIMEGLCNRLYVVHNSMGLPNSAIDGLPSDMAINYAIGLIVQHFI